MNLPRFAVTPGEPAGIGPDLCLLLAAQAQPYPLIAIASLMLCAALVAALANCPNLKAPILKFHAQRVSDLEMLDVDQDEANILLLAADGLMLMESLNVSPFSEERRRALVEAMLAMANRLAGARV